MAAPAQGLFKQTIFKKQSGLGTTAAGAGGRILRRKSSVFTAARDTTASDEINAHRQDTGIVYGLKKVSGKIDGNLSPGTYSQLMAAALMMDFATGVVCAAHAADFANVSGDNYTLKRPAGNYLSSKLKVGDVVQLTGATVNAANLAVTFGSPTSQRQQQPMTR
jgi:hypothetical protein